MLCEEHGAQFMGLQLEGLYQEEEEVASGLGSTHSKRKRKILF